MDLRARAEQLRERIGRACDRVGRPHEQVSLIAVTKTHPTEAICAALAAGLTEFGENRVQELEAKVGEVGRDGGRWHLIGHLQRNKARRALPLFDLLHSLDSLRLGEELSRLGVERGRVVPVLVQVNTAGEASKGGFSTAEVPEVVGQLAELPGLALEGLMTLAPYTEEAKVLRAVFAGTRELRDAIARQVPAFQGTELSMGMSNDFEIAVEEGATLVRLGTALFGEREP